MQQAEEKIELPDGSILNAAVHARLLSDIVNVSRQANVPVFMIHKSMKDFCTKREVEWFRYYKHHMEEGSGGVCFVGKHAMSVDTKMMAIAGAFIRNFIDARVITLSSLLQGHEDGDVPDPTVMLIPNFYIDMEGGKPLSAWQVSALHDILVERLVSARATLLYVSSFETMRKQYGDAVEQFIRTHWLTFAPE